MITYHKLPQATCHNLCSLAFLWWCQPPSYKKDKEHNYKKNERKGLTTAKKGGNATTTKVREREGQPQTERGEEDPRKKKREGEAENHRKEEEGTEPSQKRTEGTAIK